MKKVSKREKNVLKRKKFDQSGINLPEDSLIVTIAIYHPVTKIKTQEWLFLSNNTLKDINSVIQCLSNYCTFSTPAGPILFKFDEKVHKNLNTKINELELNIGSIYTYQHRGICQHDMIVTDIRLICYQDPQNYDDYPFQIYACKSKRRLCEICEKFHAKFISVRDQVLGISYVYICENCLDLIKNEFSEVYPYVHD